MSPTDAAKTPKEFVEQVKQALEHLYDFAYLQQLPLAKQLASIRRRPSESPGHHLRRELITAIEAISPGGSEFQQSPDGRIYSLLQMRYIDDITVQVAADRLGLSARQAHRLLRRGEESVATLLWMRLPQPEISARHASSARELSSVKSEIARLETAREPVDMSALVTQALTAVQPLAVAHGITVQSDVASESVVVSSDTAVARQVLVSLFGRIMAAAERGRVSVKLTSREEQTLLSVSFQTGDAPNSIVDDVLAQLADKLDWQIRTEQAANGHNVIQINLARQGALVLVIDDNEGLVEMLDRYLTGHDCRVVTATSGPIGLELAQELIPDAIILDVMIPGQSGWDILQALRGQTHTAVIPVIVCSVFNDPELAYALGATRFHSKPFSRDDILQTLRELDVV